MSDKLPNRKSKLLFFKLYAPWTGALVVGVSISALSLLGIYARLGPIAREAELKWYCKQWEGANPEPGLFKLNHIRS